MRRLLLLALLMTWWGSTAALAGSWRSYDNRSLGFSLRYPADWQRTMSSGPGLDQVSLARTGSHPYGVVISVLHLNPGHTIRETVQRFVSYERRNGNAVFAHLHWTAATLGGRSAMGSVMVPPTEGGVAISYGVYLSAWRKRTYEVTIVSYGQLAARRLSKFPSVYRQILASWRFRS